MLRFYFIQFEWKSRNDHCNLFSDEVEIFVITEYNYMCCSLLYRQLSSTWKRWRWLLLAIIESKLRRNERNKITCMNRRCKKNLIFFFLMNKVIYFESFWISMFKHFISICLLPWKIYYKYLFKVLNATMHFELNKKKKKK